MADIITYDSTVRLMWDPDGDRIVLLQLGDMMWQLVSLDGQQVVERATYVRAAASKALPRGNDGHELVFEIARQTDGPADAFKKRLTNITTLPRTGKDLLITFEDGTHFRMRDAAIQSWPARTEDSVLIERISIAGGLIEADGGTYTEGSTWGA